MENQTSAAPSMEANDPVCRYDRSVHVDTYEEEPVDVAIEKEQNINKKDKVIAIEDDDEPMHTNAKDEVIVIEGDTESDKDTTGEHINNGNTTGENSWPDDARVKCTKDGTWVISGSDDESDMVKGPALIKKKSNTYKNLLPSSSRTRPENVCWKCMKEGTLLICSRSECAAKVHKECLNCPLNVDEDGNFLCPLCWYDRVAAEYHESQKLMSFAKRKMVKCFPVLSTRSKRLKW